MLCERCQEQEARVFMTMIISGEMSKASLCQECFESAYPEAAAQAHAAAEGGCGYCGKKCGTSICPRCLAELQRFMQSKGGEFLEGRPSLEQLKEPMRFMNDVAEHMKEWIAERGADEFAESDDMPDLPSPQDAVFERLAVADSRFKMEAYRLVARAVREAVAQESGEGAQHVTGREVALAFRSLALEEFGREALPTLIDWGLFTTDDIGTLVFQMVEAGLLGARPEDKLEDFHAVYDFAAAFPME